MYANIEEHFGTAVYSRLYDLPITQPTTSKHWGNKTEIYIMPCITVSGQSDNLIGWTDTGS